MSDFEPHADFGGLATCCKMAGIVLRCLAIGEEGTIGGSSGEISDAVVGRK